MTAARFLFGQSIVALFLVGTFLGVAAMVTGWGAGMVAVILIAAGLLGLAVWLLQARVHIESPGVISDVSLNHRSLDLRTEVSVRCLHPPLVINDFVDTIGRGLPGIGDRVRLLVPIHPAAGAPPAVIIEDPSFPRLTGPTVLIGRRIRFRLGRSRRLAGRPVWTATPADRLLDRASRAISDIVLDWHRMRCRPLAESLHNTPELLALQALFDVSWRELTVQESVELLRHRVAGVPDPFWILCHCLAGGMPRDVLRMARTMFDEHRGSPGPTTLPDMARRLVAREVQAVKRAIQYEAAAEGDAALRALCADADWPGTASGDIRRAAKAELADTGVRCSIGAYLLYYAFVLDLFSAPNLPDRPAVEALTVVHRLLVINPSVALQELLNQASPIRRPHPA